MTEPDEAHYSMIARSMLEGEVVPFLGAGIDVFSRPLGQSWSIGHYLPNVNELAAYLASTFDYPPTEQQDLLRVCQYVDLVTGSGRLYEELHRLFDADYPPNPLHKLLAAFPQLVRSGSASQHQLIVTTSYDDALERAFRVVGEEFDLVTYVAEGEYRGRFRHVMPDGEVKMIDRANEYAALSLYNRPVILKIHGAVDRGDPEWDSYVITEDHYIEYLTRTDISNLIPVTLVAKLRRSHFLFFGYSLREWNLRVILNRIWGQQALTYRSWALQPNPELLDEEFWSRRGVDILAASLDEYTSALSGHLELELPS
jgi:hypothetical protein